MPTISPVLQKINLGGGLYLNIALRTERVLSVKLWGKPFSSSFSWFVNQCYLLSNCSEYLMLLLAIQGHQVPGHWLVFYNHPCMLPLVLSEYELFQFISLLVWVIKEGYIELVLPKYYLCLSICWLPLFTGVWECTGMPSSPSSYPWPCCLLWLKCL